MGRVREQPAREILSADNARQETTSARDGQLAALCRGCLAGSSSRLGSRVMYHAILRILRRLRHFFGRRAFERDVDDELPFQMDMVAERLAAHGHSHDDLQSFAHKEFGSMQRYKEEIRDARGL